MKDLFNKFFTKSVAPSVLILVVLSAIWYGKYLYDSFDIGGFDDFYVDVIIPYIRYFLLVFLLGTLAFLVVKVAVVILYHIAKNNLALKELENELEKKTWGETDTKEIEKYNKEMLGKAKEVEKDEFDKKLQSAYHGVTRFIFFLIAAIIFLQAGIDATLVILGKLEMSEGLIRITLEAITALNVIGLHVAIEPFIMGKPFEEVVEAIRDNMLLYILLGGNVILEVVIILLTKDILYKTNLFQ